MTRATAFGLVLSSLAMSAAARAEDKQETLKATVVEPYADKTEQKGEAGQEAAKVEPRKSDVGDAGGTFENTVCTNGKNRRIVELTAGDQAAKKPCEVHYKKETEQAGHDQLIWSTLANFDSCATKAKEFVGKLSGWGWSCGGNKP